MNDVVRWQQNVGLAGFFRLTAHQVDEKGDIVGSRVAADWFQNLITDAGLEGLGSSSLGPLTSSCYVGAGTATPDVSDTTLDDFVAEDDDFVGHNDLVNETSPHWRGYRVTRQFTAGVAEGNLSEVGMGDDSTNLFSRALIVDSNGDPTTITVLSNEILDVTYEIRVYATESDIPWSGTIDGVSSSGVFRLCRAGGVREINTEFGVGGGNDVYAFNGSLAPLTGNPQDTGDYLDSADSLENASYEGGSHEREFSATWNIDTGNGPDGINVFEISVGPEVWQMSVDPAIDKDSTKTLTMSWKITWARYSP